MKRIILITGGERSGKSVYAEQLALRLSEQPVYMATARIWDEEFRQRVRIHRERRGPQWTNIEEEKHLSRHDLTGRTVLVDCVTLWTTNFFFDYTLRHRGKPTGSSRNPASRGDAANRERRIPTIHFAGGDFYIRNQRNRDGRRIDKRSATPLYRLVGLDQPIRSVPSR